jgi:hypothetical protein
MATWPEFKLPPVNLYSIGAYHGIKTMTVEDTLTERGKRYGDFGGHAGITQRIKNAMQMSDNWSNLSDDKKEALEMIAHKIGRILNGDPNYADSWHDIAGYAQLIEKRLEP